MSERPSDGMELDDLRDEFDWMFEFQSRMAERISGDADVHNLVDYVGKLESENAELRKELAVTNPLFETLNDANDRLIYENMKLRELVRELSSLADKACDVIPTCCKCPMLGAETCDLTSAFQRMRELGVEV